MLDGVIDINSVFCLDGLQQKPSVSMQERDADEPSSNIQNDHDTPTLENSSHSEPHAPPPPTLPFDQSPSTRLLLLAQSQLILKPFHHLHSNILANTPITEQMRAKLHSFLMIQTSKQMLLRETFTLACTLGDLFFKHGGYVSIEQYQPLMLACLILSGKLKEGKFPTISFQTFNREQLMTLEIQVARTLHFQLTPHTYHNYAERIVFLWDQYTQLHPRFNRIIAINAVGVNHILRRFYEQLDCVFMVLKSLEYDIEDLVVNLFYINIRIISQEINVPNNLSDQQFDLAFYRNEDDLTIFFCRFLEQFYKKRILLNREMGIYLKHFLGVRTAQSEWIIAGNSQALHQMRRWEKFQSVPKDSYLLAKTVIRRVNAMRRQR